jgi:hypothetical protein
MGSCNIGRRAEVESPGLSGQTRLPSGKVIHREKRKQKCQVNAFVQAISRTKAEDKNFP